MNITKEEYQEALRAVWKEQYREVIQAYIDSPNYKASSADIAETLGKSSLGEVNLKFGDLSKRISEHLKIVLPHTNNGEPHWFRILAEGDKENGSFKWILRPTFVAALHEFGIQKSETVLPDELPDDPKEYIEGAKKQITVNAYERSREAHDICIQKYGATCQVCDFDFEKTYGELGNGFIHVHHLEPLAAKNEAYRVDPEKDLIPVCPNCHAILHKENPPIAVEMLRKIIKENKLVFT